MLNHSLLLPSDSFSFRICDRFGHFLFSLPWAEGMCLMERGEAYWHEEHLDQLILSRYDRATVEEQTI